jgi:Fur family transcriptional regulator, ferric uptake regulator
VVDSDGVVATFVGYLRDHNLPVTQQRMDIAKVLLGSDRHLSVEDVAGELHERGQKAGLATVYRTIELLVKCGLVVERDFDEGFKRFEPARDTPQHEHLLCTVCGRVTEFRDERLDRMTTLVAEAHGYLRQRHRLVIHGVCTSCRSGTSIN